MKYLLLIILTIIIVSCSPKFEVITSKTSSYADPTESIVYLGNNNIVSTFNSDLTLNPFVEKDIQSQKIKKTALELNSKFSKNFQFGEISSLVFKFNNNETIELNSIDYFSKPYMSQNGMKINHNEIVENCKFDITSDEIKILINSEIESIKIIAVKRNLIFDKDDISEKFISNLNTFFSNYLTK